MRKLYENFHIFHFQKRIVSVETIRGNMVNDDEYDQVSETNLFYWFFDMIKSPEW